MTRTQVCNAYGAGLTDWDMSSLYGKLCIFAFAAWAGQNGGVTAGLAICGVMLSVTSAACGARVPPVNRACSSFISRHCMGMLCNKFTCHAAVALQGFTLPLKQWQGTF